MRMCRENSVKTRLSRRAFMDFLMFPSLFFKSNSRLLSFERIIKRLQWQEYTRNEKEKLLNKRSKLANAADILDGKEFQIKNISFRNLLDFKAINDNRLVKKFVWYALTFCKKLKKHFFFNPTLTYRYAHFLFFFFLFQFYLLPSIGKRVRGKWKKTTLNTSFQKKN